MLVPRSRKQTFEAWMALEIFACPTLGAEQACRTWAVASVKLSWLVAFSKQSLAEVVAIQFRIVGR